MDLILQALRGLKTQEAHRQETARTDLQDAQAPQFEQSTSEHVGGQMGKAKCCLYTV